MQIKLQILGDKLKKILKKLNGKSKKTIHSQYAYLPLRHDHKALEALETIASLNYPIPPHLNALHIEALNRQNLRV